ncbi:hypothetical protein L1987_33884 [Smallanthus sonchifolius]|uniref:Uncharacterized protein n=1 Tax=Smallanthus sonchifolius TaxID=185202 RepID=A0ACB9HS11_9ASTR|nr:hypothetical protein L1987_33884 [Smallanthus sonchifolius]
MGAKNAIAIQFSRLSQSEVEAFCKDQGIKLSFNHVAPNPSISISKCLVGSIAIKEVSMSRHSRKRLASSYAEPISPSPSEPKIMELSDEVVGKPKKASTAKGKESPTSEWLTIRGECEKLLSRRDKLKAAFDGASKEVDKDEDWELWKLRKAQTNESRSGYKSPSIDVSKTLNLQGGNF